MMINLWWRSISLVAAMMSSRVFALPTQHSAQVFGAQTASGGSRALPYQIYRAVYRAVQPPIPGQNRDWGAPEAFHHQIYRAVQPPILSKNRIRTHQEHFFARFIVQFIVQPKAKNRNSNITMELPGFRHSYSHFPKHVRTISRLDIAKYKAVLFQACDLSRSFRIGRCRQLPDRTL